MTLLGIYLYRKSINKAEVSRKTKLSPSRLSELTLNEKSRLRVTELCLIAEAVDVQPCELLTFICDEANRNEPK